MLPHFVPNYSVGPLIGLVVNGLLALLCLVVLITYRSYRPLKFLLLFYVALSAYFLGFTMYGYQFSERSIINWYRLMLLALCFAPVAWVWFACSLQGIRPGPWAWFCLGLALFLSVALLTVEHPLVLGGPLDWQSHAGVWHPQSLIFRPLIYTYDLLVVMVTIILFWFRWWRGPGKPAYVRAILAGLSLWFFGGFHDAIWALHVDTGLGGPVMWLGSVWLSLCLALAMAYHMRDLDNSAQVSRAMFSKAFALNPDGLVITSLEDGAFLEANEAFLRMVGLKREQVVGRLFQDLGIRLGEGPGQQAWLGQLASQVSQRDREVQLTLPRGKVLAVLWSAEVIQFGGKSSVLTVIHDVTERKRVEKELDKHRHHLEDLVTERTTELSQANQELQREIAERRRTEEALRQSRADLQTLFDSLQDFLLVLDDQGCILAVNPPVTQRLGYSAQELIGSRMLLLHPANRQEEASAVVAAVLDGSSDRSNIPLMAKDGGLVPVETRITPGRWGERKVFFGVSRDISERQRAQEVLRQLAAGVAHNFNNLLAAILGNAQAAEAELRHEEPELSRLRQLLDNVVLGALSGRGLVQRMAAYVGGRRPQQEVNEDADVAEVAAAAVKIAQAAWRPQSPKYRVEFARSLEPGLRVAVQRSELMEVCLNLIRNALEAMPKGGRLSVSARAQDDQICLEFGDTGLGMDAETTRRIFEPFFSTKGVAGQGLGLASSRGIVRAYGGDISVQSAPGQGTTFAISLPQRPASAPPPQTEMDLPELKAEGKVLLVEDEALVAMGVRAMLEEAGYTVCLASRVAEALEALDRFQPDLVLSDLGLPDGTGWDVALEVTRSPRPEGARPVPFVLVTGWTTDPGLMDPPPGAPQAWAVLQKPVDRSMLLFTLGQALA